MANPDDFSEMTVDQDLVSDEACRYFDASVTLHRLDSQR